VSIEHISDTALWVAHYRALESERPDALFRDPYARRLAGEKGEQIVREMPQGERSAWAMIVRTAVMDRLIREQLAAGVDTVVNLAAGLDARPWRMELPSSLRWVDVDFPEMLSYKLETLEGETPPCVYHALGADLTDPNVRNGTLADATAGSARALVITEGLLIYLEERDVADLAQDLHATGVAVSWITDLASPQLLKWMSRTWGKRVSMGNARFRFAPQAGTAFFEPFGWREGVYLSLGEEAQRLNREMQLAWLWRLVGRLMSSSKREEMRRMMGIVGLERVDEPAIRRVRGQ
jgi:methyltransferase (TIGR00027 family)